MSQSVSVPEKTLEHWSSQYVTYRYGPKAALWWPTHGVDIDVGSLSRRPGKVVQLELKTATPSGAGFQDVFVDLGQLWKYRQRPLGHQPFYAFPRPDWRGQLTVAADAEGRKVTELGFSRSGPGWWFADWMILLTAAEVAGHKELTAHGRKERKSERLVRFDLSHSMDEPVITWGSGAAVSDPEPIGWREFWPTLERCGRAGWPHLIRFPQEWITPTQDLYPRSHVLGILRETADRLANGEWDDDEPLVTLEPDEGGDYHVAPASDNLGAPEEETEQIGDHRLNLFLEARVLHQAR
jgi:hypothetical protein